MLEIADLSVTYGGTVSALRGVSVTVPDRGVVAVLGPNGAGKTTLLRSIMGTLGIHRGRIDGGTVTFDGRNLGRTKTAATVRSGVVLVPEGRRIFTRLTVDENLRAGSFGSRDKAAKARLMADAFERFPILADRRRLRAGLLSGGEQQMLAIARALMAGPTLLLLDEPSLGLAPLAVDRMGEVVSSIRDDGVAVMLVEQNATMALRVADHAYVLDVGQVSLTGPAAELAATDEVRNLYLGHGADAFTVTSGSAAADRLTPWVA